MKSFNLILLFFCISLITNQMTEDSFLSLEDENKTTRKITQRGINLIKEFEGVRLTAYKCPAGQWTIGYGHTKGVYQGMTISQAQANSFLAQDIAEFEGYVNRQSMSFDPNQNQFDALVSFSFNLGSKNLGTLVKNRSSIQVADAILLYNKAGGKVLPGLVRRRKAERDLFLS